MDIKDLIIKEARAQGVEPNLALGIAKQESRFNQNARSPAGAIGVMQLMPDTAKEMGVNPYNLEENIRGGIAYLKKVGGMFGNDPALTAAGYNAGPGAVQKYGGVPPFKETQKYVPSVLSYAKEFSGPNMQMIQQAPQFQEPAPAPAGGYQIDPRIFAGAPPQAMGKGLQTLMTVLGSLGALGGTAANVIGGLKGSGSPGDAAILQSSGIFNMLGKDRQAAQDYAQKQAVLGQLPPEVATQYALGGGDAAAKFISENTPDKRNSRAVDAALKKQQLDSYESPDVKRAKDLKVELEKEKRQFDNQMALMKTRAGIKTDDPVALAKLTMDFQNEAMKRQPIKQMLDSGQYVNSINAVWQDYTSGSSQLGGKNALSQVLINNFNKINDPASVVRESEYARTGEGQSLANRLPGALEKLQKGGAGLVDSELADLVKASNIIQESRVKSAKPLIDSLFSTAAKAGIKPEDILPLDEVTKGFLLKSQSNEDVQKINNTIPKSTSQGSVLSQQDRDLLSRYGGRAK